MQIRVWRSKRKARSSNFSGAAFETKLVTSTEVAATRHEPLAVALSTDNEILSDTHAPRQAGRIAQQNVTNRHAETHHAPVIHWNRPPRRAAAGHSGAPVRAAGQAREERHLKRPPTTASPPAAVADPCLRPGRAEGQGRASRGSPPARLALLDAALRTDPPAAGALRARLALQRRHGLRKNPAPQRRRSRTAGWLLGRGVRGSGYETPRRRWGYKDFAEKCEFSDRQVRNWRRNRHPPRDLDTIERVLFGPTPEKHYGRCVGLRDAWPPSRAQSIGRVATFLGRWNLPSRLSSRTFRSPSHATSSAARRPSMPSTQR